MRRARLIAGLALGLISCTGLLASRAHACEPSVIGLNKFDLVLQYIGRASMGDGSPAYTQVTRAMARKAIQDAAAAGVTYFRVSGPGFKPTDLELWQKNPAQYWAALDLMMADLKAANICLVLTLDWNPVQFPTITGESVGALLKDPKSASWQLLEGYVRDFVGRYKGSPSILFWELTNELNNHADIDNAKVCERRKRGENCEAVSNFSTDDMNAFTARFAALVRSIDSTHKISSGFTAPRPAAQHLRRHPAWLGHADWSEDSPAELEEQLRDIHKSVDVISVHLYRPNSSRMGLGNGDQYRIVEIMQTAANHIGKPLFIGEFGDENIREANDNSFITKMENEIVRLKVPYSAIWIWEFYQRGLDAPYSSEPSDKSLEPGYTDFAIERLRQINASGRALAAGAVTPEVVLTQPLECSSVSAGSELYAVASNGTHGVDSVDFLVDAKSVAHVTQPPYKAQLPAVEGRGGAAEIETRACSGGKCGSYKARVITGSGGQCQVRLQ